MKAPICFLAAFAAAGIFCAPFASAQTPTMRAAQAKEALARFDALAADAAKRGDLPHLSDPAAATVLHALWAAGVGQPSDGFEDLAAMGQMESAELGVLSRYEYFPGPTAAPIDWDHIATLFPDELAGSFAASIGTASEASKALDSAESSGLNIEQFAAIIRQLRLPCLGLFLDAQKFLEAHTTPAEAKVQVARAFADHAQDFILIFPPLDRRLFADAMQRTAERLSGPERGYIERFIAALRDAPCGALCTIPRD